MKKRITIIDVAKEAKVSTATVSYVLNNTVGVSIGAEVSKRVREVADRLGYVPNLSARTLVNHRSNLIGVLIPQTEQGKGLMFGNPFYGELLSSIEYSARNKGYHILITGASVDTDYMRIAKYRALDGIIVVGMYENEFMKQLSELNTPIVMIDSYSNNYHFHSVGINDRYGGYLATKYLLDKGHRRIAFVSGSVSGRGVNEHRFNGYKDALNEFNLPYDEKLALLGSVDFDYGIEAATKLSKLRCDCVKKGIEPPTACFATADVLSIGLIKGFGNCGLNVPQDFSVVGFDDVFLARLCNPSLTTVRQDITEKGKSAVELIIASIEDKIDSRRDVILPLEIIERDSVKEK